MFIFTGNTMELNLFLTLLVASILRKSFGMKINESACGMANKSDIVIGDVPLSLYPWLGILYRSSPSRGVVRAMATVALIHEAFVIAPASEVGPMLKHDFRKSRVILGADRQRGGRRVRSCIVHPEYRETHNAVALVQLRDAIKYIKALCPPVPHLLGNPKLYVIKFHEDFTNLQKQVIPVSNVPGKLCRDMYISSNMYARKAQSQHVVCAVTDDKRKCIWRAGAALVSRDVMGRWQLRGLGMRGPGCGAPSFFLHMLSYLTWIRNSFDTLRKPVTSELLGHHHFDCDVEGKYENNISVTEIRNCEWDAGTSQQLSLGGCAVLNRSVADIDTADIYPTFEFQLQWKRSKTFWNKTFEERYKKMRKDSNSPTLKVIVVPHSHNDPGWLRTFDHYFKWKTKNIIDNIAHKLYQYPNMTFIWNEISYLDAWWQRAQSNQQEAIKKLVKEGRLEITTGGWVMPDEACTHIYGLIDQLFEGHDWVQRNLGVLPKTGWSVDPFGHGPTVPYLLNESGLEGTIIQRIHYAWKQWLGHKQIQDFYWIPGWSTEKPSLIVHNQPLDLYSIRYSCGPHTSVCLSFDFRKIAGEYTEYTAKHEEISDDNLEVKSKILIEEYRRVGSLTSHNVVLVPLGDDFRYEHDIEFDAQYVNYMKMFNYINSHKEQFNAEVQFGTPLDYFNAMKERHFNIPTLRGDFFVYSDKFTEGKPAYWSGYYTTRPYFKLLTRQFEHQLRTSEILFTLVYNYIRQNEDQRLNESKKKLEHSYELLVAARQNYGLFQHHDAITGTSKEHVMYDYGTKLFISNYDCIRLQETAMAAIMIPNEKLHSRNILHSAVEWKFYGDPVEKVQVNYVNKNKIVIFNALAEDRTEVVSVRSDTTDIRLYDNRQRQFIPYQINANIEIDPDGKPVISNTSFNILFVATLPALTAVSFNLEHHTNKSHHCEVFCNNCNYPQKPDSEKLFNTKKMMPGDIQLENSYLTLLINRNTGFLRQIFRKEERKRNVVEMQFGAYQSAQRHSGAYLFMPDYDSPEKSVLHPYSNQQDDNIVIVSGPVSTEITTMYLPFLVHTVRIYNVDDPALSRGVFIENVVDFESPPKNRETELYMRIQTDIQNGDIPEYYTDQNGFQYQKRVKVEKLGIEANYYPITTMAWLQDETTRLTLITNHAQGSSAFEPGRLELMLDRRTLYDDFRGIGEGVVDNKPTVFHNWLLLEAVAPERRKRDAGFGHVNQRHFGPGQRDARYELPSQTAEFLSRALNYPVNTYLIDSSEAGEVAVHPQQSLVSSFPAGVHLLTLRTITDAALEQFPSRACYMVLQRPGHSCAVGTRARKPGAFSPRARFNGLNVANLTAVSLTGLRTYRALAGLHDIRLQPMDVKTYKIKF